MIASFNKTSSDILLSLYDGPFQQPLWKDFLIAFRTLANASAANVALQMPTGEIKGIYTFDKVVDQNDYSGFSNVQNVYENEFAQHSPFPYDSMSDNTLYLLDDVILRQDFEQSHFYLEFCQPLGFEYQLCISIAEQSGYKAFLHLARSKDQGNFSQTFCKEIRPLIPHLQKSLHIYSELQRSKLGMDASDEALMRLGVGIIVINRDSQRLWQNNSVQGIIEKNEYISDENHHLAIDLKAINSRKKTHQLWNDLLESLFQSDDTSKSIAIALPSTNRLGVLVRRWQGRSSAPIKQRPCFIISLTEAENNNTISHELVQQLFALTPAEAKLAARLAQGESLAQAAVQLNITEKSARGYCKRIYAKAGVNRLTELVALVRNSVAYMAS